MKYSGIKNLLINFYPNLVSFFHILSEVVIKFTILHLVQWQDYSPMKVYKEKSLTEILYLHKIKYAVSF